MATKWYTLWLLHICIINIYANYNCSTEDFPINLNGIQCHGLTRAVNVNSLQECMEACCAEHYCQTYQFCANGTCQHNSCWIGQMNFCSKSTSEWVSRGRHSPSPPIKLNVDFWVGPMSYALLNSIIFMCLALLSYNLLFHAWKTEKLSRSMMFMIFTFGLSCSITDTVRMCHIWTYKTDAPNSKWADMMTDKWYNLKMLADFFYFCMTTSLQTLLLGRVYHVFANSYFKLSKLTMAILICLVSLFFITGCVYCVLGMRYSDHTPTDLANDLVFTLAILDFLLTFSLIIVFAYKLKALMLMVHIYDSKRTRSLSGINTNTDFSVQKKDSSLRNVIIRHTVTSLLALFFDQIMYHLSWMLNYGLYRWIRHIQPLGAYKGGAMFFAVRSLCILGVIISVYMSTPYGKKYYFACCRLCHNCPSCLSFKRADKN